MATSYTEFDDNFAKMHDTIELKDTNLHDYSKESLGLEPT